MFGVQSCQRNIILKVKKARTAVCSRILEFEERQEIESEYTRVCCTSAPKLGVGVLVGCCNWNVLESLEFGHEYI
jgi:hypothetical protein